MSLFGKIKNILRAGRDKAEASLSDVERDSKFAIEDSKKQIGEFQGKIANIMSLNKRSITQRDEAEAEATKFGRIAASAAKAGNEDDVRSAIEKKSAAQRNFDTLSAQVVQNEKAIAALRSQLATSRTRVAGAESNRTRLLAQHEGAKIRKEMALASSQFAGDSPLSALDDLENQVNAADADASAWEELTGSENTGDDLESKYDTNATSADDEVARLMREAKGE